MSLFVPGVSKFIGDKTGDVLGDLTGQSEVEEAAKSEASKMDELAAEAKAMAAEQAGNLAEAENIRAGILQQGYTDAQAQVSPWAGVGDASRQGYEDQILTPSQEFGTDAGSQFQQQALMGPSAIDPRLSQYNPQGLSSEVMQQAATTPQSQYFDQAAQTAMARPSRLEDIEGYGLMQQARDEALQASGQQFAGQGKFMSGSRIAEAGNIGARQAQGLIAQDDFRRQQDVQNLMGFGVQEVAMNQQGLQNRLGAEGQQFGMGNQTFQNQMGLQGMQDQRSQQGFQNLGAAAQQGLGVQQMNYGAQQGQLDRQRDLMGFGYGVDQRAGDLSVQQAQQLGQGGYSSAQDQANILMGGQAQSSGLTQAGSGFRMGGAASRQQMMGDLINAGAGLAGGI